MFLPLWPVIPRSGCTSFCKMRKEIPGQQQLIHSTQTPYPARVRWFSFWQTGTLRPDRFLSASTGFCCFWLRRILLYKKMEFTVIPIRPQWMDYVQTGWCVSAFRWHPHPLCHKQFRNCWKIFIARCSSGKRISFHLNEVWVYVLSFIFRDGKTIQKKAGSDGLKQLFLRKDAKKVHKELWWLCLSIVKHV